MQKFIKQLLLTLTCVLCTLFAAYAQLQKVYLPMLETINLKKDFQYSSTKLLKNYIDASNRYQVVMQENSDSIVFSSDQVNLIQNKAKLNNANYFITGSLNRLGETVIVNINLFETESGNKIWFDQLKALTPDDLDPILQRFGANLGTMNKAATNEDIYSVTNNEAQTLKKKESNNNFGVGLSSTTLLFNDQQGTLPGLSVAWSFDARDYIFDIRPSWSFNSTQNLVSLSLEMNKPLQNTASTPFFGGGLAFSRTDLTYSVPVSYYNNTYKASGYGMMLIAGGGYIFNRTSSVSVRVSGNYLLGLYDVKNSDYSNVSYTKNYGLTNGILLRLEILFGRR